MVIRILVLTGKVSTFACTLQPIPILIPQDTDPYTQSILFLSTAAVYGQGMLVEITLSVRIPSLPQMGNDTYPHMVFRMLKFSQIQADSLPHRSQWTRITSTCYLEQLLKDLRRIFSPVLNATRAAVDLRSGANSCGMT